MKKQIFRIFAMIWMIAIFILSAQEATASSATSSYFLQVFIDYFSLNLNEYDSLWGFLIFLIRKSAHIFEYFVLTLLLYGSMSDKRNRKMKALLFATLYACSDEIHQLFVVGRSGALIDVFVDMIGMIGAIALIEAYSYLKKERR